MITLLSKRFTRSPSLKARLSRLTGLMAAAAILTAASAILLGEEKTSWSLPNTSDPTSALIRRDYHYRMRGMVRLLIFWVGRDNVGGGRISFLGPLGREDSGWTDGVEVLFGSDPERVPGGHNRWGYARELAYWQGSSESGSPFLLRTLFEGFMSDSQEDSLNEVEEGSGENSVFKGTICTVERTNARSRLWRFQVPKESSYWNPEPVGTVYSAQVRSRSPDSERLLDNQANTYSRPQGFLTVVREIIREALEKLDRNSSLLPLEGRKHAYVHSAKLFLLSVRKSKLHRKFQLSGGQEFERVLELTMKTEHQESGEAHNFALHIATDGSLRAVPLRIEDRPRWWLRIRLELDLGSMTAKEMAGRTKEKTALGGGE